MCNPLHDGSRIHRCISDLSLNILLFIGQEVISIARAADIVLAHQTIQGLLHLLPHDDLIHPDIIRHQDDDIVQICLDVIDITHQIQQL